VAGAKKILLECNLIKKIEQKVHLHPEEKVKGKSLQMDNTFLLFFRTTAKNNWNKNGFNE